MYTQFFLKNNNFINSYEGYKLLISELNNFSKLKGLSNYNRKTLESHAIEKRQTLKKKLKNK